MIRPKMRSGKKELVGKATKEIVTVFKTARAVTPKLTGAMSNNGQNSGIFLGEVSSELVVLGARLQKLEIRLLEMNASGEELGMTRGQSGGTALLTSV